MRPTRIGTVAGILLLGTSALAACAEPSGKTTGPLEAESSLSASEPSVQTVEIGHGGGIDVEVGEGGLWLTTRDGVLEIDPATNEIVKDIPLDGAFRLAIGEGQCG